MLYQFALILALGVLAWFIWRAMDIQKQRKSDFEDALNQCANGVLDNPRKAQNETFGVHTYEESLEDGGTLQVRFISDTLAVRKLPVLWLSISLIKPIPMEGRYDVMCRPAATMSFSNFHLLPHALSHPLNRELHMQLRSSEMHMPDWVSQLIEDYVPLKHSHAKELIIDPKGLRFVFHLADADRARYGVLRQAAFSTEGLQPKLIADLIESLLNLHEKACNMAQEEPINQESKNIHAA